MISCWYVASISVTIALGITAFMGTLCAGMGLLAKRHALFDGYGGINCTFILAYANAQRMQAHV